MRISDYSYSPNKGANYLIKFGLKSALERSRDILKQVWGYESFRPLQEDIVDAVIYGHDTLAILPTGGGKTVCFQVPGLALDGITIVVSPLIALMQDQVEQLQKRNIKAAYITSSMNYREIDITLDNARFSEMKFLYVSPERLKSPLFLERFKLMNVSLIVVDEAHCISEWGHDFRPSYREISELRAYHPDVPLVAFTASATERVKQDIVTQLELRKPSLFLGELKRENLSYRVIASENKLQSVIDFCKDHTNQTAIVYCQTRRSVKEVAKQLRSHNVSAGIYHGGMSGDDRKYMQQLWMSNQIRVMVATNAFGMGIDKPDVRYVLHFEISDNLEAYYQEAGRAGRDGMSAQAIVYWEEGDIVAKKRALEQKYPPIERVKLIYSSVCNFLSIAYESGLNETFEFDLRKFTTSFSIPAGEVFHALKLLETNGTLSFSEGAFIPTRMKFAIGNSALYKFQVSHDSVTDLISALTRSYPGIFERFMVIDEAALAKRLSINAQELKRQLLFLEEYGVIDITFKSDLPQLTLLQERLPEDRLQLSHDVYLGRKENEITKLDALTNFLSTEECRAVYISNYFDSEIEACGICDNCKHRLSSNYTERELLEIIPTLLPKNRNQLVNLLNVKPELIDTTLRKLMLEEIIYSKERVYYTA